MALGVKSTKKSRESEAKPAAPSEPPSKLAQAKAVVEAANGPIVAAQAELAALQDRIGRAQRELAALDRGLGLDGQPIETTAAVDRRIALRQELDAARPLLRPLERRVQEAVERRRRAEQDLQQVELQIHMLEQRIDDQHGRISRQRRLVEDAESLLAGHRHALGRLETHLASLQAEVVQTAGE